VNKASFEQAWYPRIGKDATEQLWKGRWAIVWFALVFTFAVASSFLWGDGPVGDALGALLTIGWMVCAFLIMRARRRTSAAISDWFGIERLKAIPSMTPERFDRWRTNRGYMRPDERRASGQPKGPGKR
jgi:hypothetical protein